MGSNHLGNHPPLLKFLLILIIGLVLINAFMSGSEWTYKNVINFFEQKQVSDKELIEKEKLCARKSKEAKTDFAAKKIYETCIK